jgi:predicted DNA-binding transcriptional regulator YafY
MSTPKPRLARLTDILLQLQSKRLVTSSFLAKKFDVSVRTIYRDIRTLEESGVPIVVEEGKGYMLMEGYQLPPVMFTEEEANALITAEQLLLKNKDKSLVTAYQNATTKIKSVLRHSHKEKTELLSERILVRANNDKEITSHYLITLQTVITSYSLIDITYLSLKNELTKRILEPFALYTTQDKWLLIAYCRKREDFRVFRIDQIQKLNVLNENFTPHDMTLQQYFEICRTKQSTPDIRLS